MEINENKKAKEDDLTAGFLGEGTVKLAGHELRPFTFGSFTLCRKLNLTLFTKDGATEELDEDETMRQLAAFFWIQSQPVKDVLDAVRAGTAELSIEDFQFEIPVHALPAIMRRVTALSQLAAAAAVEIEDKPTTAGSEGDEAPKN